MVDIFDKLLAISVFLLIITFGFILIEAGFDMLNRHLYVHPIQYTLFFIIGSILIFSSVYNLIKCINLLKQQGGNHK